MVSKTQMIPLADAIENERVRAGENVLIQDGALFQPDPDATQITRLGSDCEIQTGAIISQGAQIGDGCLIGPYACIEANVRIGAHTRIDQGTKIGSGIRIGQANHIMPHSVIINRVEIGSENVIGPFISIGTPPQHLTMRVSPGLVRIGDHNVLREYMTIHMPTHDLTSIGNHCYMMAYNHIPHDAIIYDHVTIANSCQIGGHTVIQHHANLGLSCVIHQFTVIGAGAMVAMGSVIYKDIPPYVTFISGAAVKLNRIGLERNGKSAQEIESLRQLYANADADSLKRAFADGQSEWWFDDFREFFELEQRELCDFSRIAAT